MSLCSCEAIWSGIDNQEWVNRGAPGCFCCENFDHLYYIDTKTLKLALETYSTIKDVDIYGKYDYTVIEYLEKELKNRGKKNKYKRVL